MKQTYRTWGMLGVVLALALVIFSGCKKSLASAESDTDNQRTTRLFTPDSTNIGSMVINKEFNGGAKVVVALNPTLIAAFEAPISLQLVSKTLPTADLSPINDAGVSETFPVVSSNRGVVVSYNALTRMGDLQLKATDRQGRVVILVDAL